MGAPKVEVILPQSVFVGRPTAITIRVIAAKDTKCEFIDVTVKGHQGWVVGSGKNATRHWTTYPELALRLTDACTIPTGANEYRTQFTLPPNAAPTHGHGVAYASVTLKVHVSIPWWPDGRYSFEIPVRAAPPDAVERKPVLAQNTAAPNKPRIELSLASQNLIAGEALVGSVAMFHVDDDKPIDLDLTLVPSFRLFGRGRVRERAGTSHRFEFAIPAGGAGKAAPFQLAIPTTITPTFESVTQELRWFIVAKHGRFFSSNIELAVPVTIFDRAAISIAPRLVAAPRLADERVVAVFAQVARELDWRIGDPTEDGSPTIETDAGETLVSVAYAYRGEAGTVLVAKIAHPSLGLELDVTPGSIARHAFFRDIEVDIASWDRAHHVTARSAEQTVPFLRQVVPSLAEVRDATFMRWTDEEIVFERPIGAIDATGVTALIRAVAPIAGAIDASIGSIAPPIATDLDAWRSLARSMTAALVAGDLSIDGTLEGTRIGIELEWDTEKRPIAIRVHAGDSSAASELVKAVAIDLATPSVDAGTTKLPDGVGDALASWPLDITTLRVAQGVASARMTAIDPARARDLARRLKTLLAMIDPTAGPYR